MYPCTLSNRALIKDWYVGIPLNHYSNISMRCRSNHSWGHEVLRKQKKTRWIERTLPERFLLYLRRLTMEFWSYRHFMKLNAFSQLSFPPRNQWVSKDWTHRINATTSMLTSFSATVDHAANDFSVSGRYCCFQCIIVDDASLPVHLSNKMKWASATVERKGRAICITKPNFSKQHLK